MRRYQMFARPGSRYSRRLNHNRANIVAHFATRSRLSAPGHERPIDGGLDESAYPPIATVSLHCRQVTFRANNDHNLLQHSAQFPPAMRCSHTASKLVTGWVFAASSSRRTEEHMATLRERMRARREAERRKLRIFTIGVSDDDLRVIAKQDGYQGALTEKKYRSRG